LIEEALERKEKSTGKASEVLDKKPELTDSQQLVWNAFNYLHESRTMGYSSPNPIPIPDIIACMGLTYESAEDLVKLVHRLDNELLDWLRKNKG